MKRNGRTKQEPELRTKRLADKWRCEEDTIRKWRNAGAPFADEDAMIRWLGRRHLLPRGTAQLLMERGARPTPAPPDQDGDQLELPDPGPIAAEDLGTSQALRRLDEAEFRAFKALEMALVGGNSYSIKHAREAWMETVECQRRVAVTVEGSRVRSGELIERAVVEEGVTKSLAVVRTRLMQLPAALALQLSLLVDKKAIQEKLEDALRGALQEASQSEFVQPKCRHCGKEAW